jgi:transglutaminase-like putative cysteine protease
MSAAQSAAVPIGPAASLPSDTGDFRHMVWLLAGLALSAAPHAARLAWWISAGAALIFAWRLTIAWREKPLPNRWLVMLIAGMGIVGVWLTFRTIFGRDAGVSMLVLLLAMKLLEMRAARDVSVLVFLAYFLALTNFFYSQTIPTAGLMLLTVLLVTSSLVGFNAPSRPVKANLRTAGTLLLQASPVMLLLFFLFPRVQGPLWGVPQDAFAGVTGLSDSMSPGTLSQLSTSDAIAFRAKFDGSPPTRGRLYWRGPVFWNFDGRTWRAGPQRLREASFEGLGDPVEYEITVEPHNRFWLFGLDLPARAPRNARYTEDYQLISNQAVRGRIRYDLRSYINYRATGGADEDDRRAALSIPGVLNPRARELGRRWREEHRNDEAILRAAVEFFRQSKFLYTLEPALLQRDFVDEFLFDTRQGFCEHFASSFAFLMRAAGIPSRVVTGYQGGELNPVDEYVVVRQSEAHAWVEVLMGERGWVRVDPTAAATPVRVESGLAAAVPQNQTSLLMREGFNWMRSMRHNWDAIANQWNQWVLGYNPERQRDMLNRIGISDADWRTLAQMLFWSVAGVLGVTALYLLWRIRASDPVQKAWLAFCAKAARRGVVRAPAEGPLDYGARASAAMPEQAETVREITGMYADLRYGRAASNDAVARFRERVKAFRA